MDPDNLVAFLEAQQFLRILKARLDYDRLGDGNTNPQQGWVRQSQIEQQMRVSGVHIEILKDKLKEASLVTEDQHPEFKTPLYRLTEKGSRLLNQVAVPHD